MPIFKALLERLTRKARERRLQDQARAVFVAWDEAQRAYAARVANRDTRGQHDAWPKLHDATNARLRAGV